MSGLRGLIQRLKTYDVTWNFTFVPADEATYEPGIDREETDLEKANVVSSEIQDFWDCRPDGERLTPRRHAVLLDIDYPAYLEPSSRPDHYHLYLDVPGGVAHDDYMELLGLLGRIGVIEPGYAEVSQKRGHSDLRLPWVKKSDQKLASPEQQKAAIERISAAEEADIEELEYTASLAAATDVF